MKMIYSSVRKGKSAGKGSNMSFLFATTKSPMKMKLSGTPFVDDGDTNNAEKGHAVLHMTSLSSLSNSTMKGSKAGTPKMDTLFK